MKRLMAIIRKNAFVIVGLCIFAIIGIMAYRSKTKEYFDNDDPNKYIDYQKLIPTFLAVR